MIVLFRRGDLARSLLLLSLFAASCGEWVEVAAEVGLRGEAKRDPFLALERFSTAMGLEAIREDGYREPPLLDQVLFCPARLVTYGGGTTQELLAWVRQGGHAVLYGFDVPEPDEAPRTTPLLEELRVVLHGTRGFLHHAEAVSYDLPTFALVQDLGAGRITLLADSSPFENSLIGTPGHAERWWDFVRSSGAPSAVVIVKDEVVSWWVLVWHRAWPFVVSLLVLTLAWIVARAARFGPLVAEPTESRRAFVEHVRASGRYLARVQGIDGTVEAMREIVRRKLHRRRPDLVHQDDGALGEAAAALASLDAAEGRAALTEPTRPRGLPRRIEVLSRMLRKS